MFPVWMHACDHILDGPLHLEIDQVLSVHDLDPVIGASVPVEHGRVHVPLILPAVGVQHGTVHTAETPAHSRRAGDREGSGGIDVRPEVERTIRGRVAFDRRHCRLGALGGKRAHRDEVLLILDVPGLDFQEPCQRSRDLVNAERLCRSAFTRFRQDDIPFHHILRMDAEGRIAHLQLIGAVPLFRHIAGQRVTELADAVGVEGCFCFGIDTWDHSVHHLGVISTWSIAPLHAMWFFPGFRSGKSSLFT